MSATIQGSSTDRRAFLGVSAASLLLGAPIVANAEAGADTMPDSLDVNDFLRSGMVSQPMGVSVIYFLLVIGSGNRTFSDERFYLVFVVVRLVAKQESLDLKLELYCVMEVMF